jgi:hypothetical protein
MSYDFKIVGETLPSPDVFKALREVQYQSQKDNDYTGTAFSKVIRDYNRAGSFMSSPLPMLGIFLGILPTVLLPHRKYLKPKPRLRDFKPKPN